MSSDNEVSVQSLLVEGHILRDQSRIPGADCARHQKVVGSGVLRPVVAVTPYKLRCKTRPRDEYPPKGCVRGRQKEYVDPKGPLVVRYNRDLVRNTKWDDIRRDQSDRPTTYIGAVNAVPMDKIRSADRFRSAKRRQLAQ
jgi:hypothetical protein